MLSYFKGAELPALRVWWLDSAGALVDFTTGWTWQVKVGTPAAVAVLTKTTGVTGAAGSGTAPTGVPNVTVAWASGELDVPAGNYTLQLEATNGTSQRVMQTFLTVLPVVG